MRISIPDKRMHMECGTNVRNKTVSCLKRMQKCSGRDVLSRFAKVVTQQVIRVIDSKYTNKAVCISTPSVCFLWVHDITRGQCHLGTTRSHNVILVLPAYSYHTWSPFTWQQCLEFMFCVQLPNYILLFPEWIGFLFGASTNSRICNVFMKACATKVVHI